MDKATITLYCALFPLIALPVWAAGGAYKPWQGPFLLLCLLAWAGFLFHTFRETPDVRKRRLRTLGKDPATWASLGFLFFLLIQYLNSSRMRTFDFDANAWIYSPPKWEHLPWSITRSESFEMIQWFAPTLTVLLLLKHTGKHLSPRILCWLVGLNGFLNALLAFVHQYLGWEYMYNFKKFGKDVYGSFGYPNHGALYFILLFALALGLLLRELMTESSERDMPTLWFSALWTPVFFMAANLSTSRAGILGSWLVLILTLLTIGGIAWPRLHPAQRITGGVFALILMGGFIGGFIAFTQPIHLKELRSATVDLNVFNEIQARFFQIETAWEIFLDYSWFGVGGWGYRYFVAEYLPVEQWGLLGTGKANVHNDWMQFLCEFGAVGFGLLLIIVAPLFTRTLRNLSRFPTDDQSLWGDPLRIACFWGLVMLFLDSQFDIPLRSPAMMIHGLILWYVLTPHPETPSIWKPVVDWKRLQPPVSGMKNRIWGVQPEDFDSPEGPR